MAHNRMKSMMQGAFVLTVASFIAKLLSAIYRVPFQNFVGDEGFYVYQQVYPIYGLAMTLSLSGLPQFISKAIAEKHSLKEQQRAITELYPLVFWLATLLWMGFFFFSRWLAVLMGNADLQPLIRMVSFSFLLVPQLAFYRGNFQGELMMVPSAVSQVLEQLIRVGIILFAAMGFREWSWSVYQVGTIAMAGSVVGGLVAWLSLAYYDQKIHGVRKRFLYFPVNVRVNTAVGRRFLVEAGLLSIYSGLLILFQLIDAFSVVNALKYSGMAEQTAWIAKGVYDRGQPLVQLGLVVAAGLSSTFLPALTSYLVEKRQQLYLQSVKIYLRITVGLATAASIGLAILLPYLNFALFKDAEGTLALTLFVLSIALTATIQAYQSVAQSQNHFRSALQAAGWGLLVKFLATGSLTLLFGTVGASLSTLLGLLVILIILIRREAPQVNAFWTEGAYLKKLVACVGGMAVAVVAVCQAWLVLLGPVSTRGQALTISLVGVVVGVLVFIKLAIALRWLTIREWLMLPFGKKILRFMGGK